jgi:hypothetical protein
MATTDDLGKQVASLGTSITSPAKLVFVAYAALAYKGVIRDVSLGQFVWVAAAFFIVQVLHDDYLRIVLNGWAEAKAYRAKKKAGVP